MILKLDDRDYQLLSIIDDRFEAVAAKAADDNLTLSGTVKSLTHKIMLLEKSLVATEERLHDLNEEITFKHEKAMHNLTHYSQRVGKLEADDRTHGSIAIKNLIERVAELEGVHGTKCIRPECGSINDGVDGKCLYHSQDDLEAVE